MYYTIYQTTNLINQKIYIGKHQTERIDDNYLGSGRAILAAIAKYGKESFQKQVLFICETEEEMNQKEKDLVTEEFVTRSDTYNLGVGGEGGPHFLGKTHSAATRLVLSSKGKTRIFSDETRQKLSDSNRRRVINDSTRLKISEKAIARYHSTDIKKKISESVKKSHASKKNTAGSAANTPVS